MADIEDNRFYKIVMDRSLSPAEHVERASQQLADGNPDREAAVREYAEFKAYLAETREYLAKALGVTLPAQPLSPIEMILSDDITVRSQPLKLKRRFPTPA
jgi:hypothetical protein